MFMLLTATLCGYVVAEAPPKLLPPTAFLEVAPASWAPQMITQTASERVAKITFFEKVNIGTVKLTVTTASGKTYMPENNFATNGAKDAREQFFNWLELGGYCVSRVGETGLTMTGVAKVVGGKPSDTEFEEIKSITVTITGFNKPGFAPKPEIKGFGGVKVTEK